MAAAADPAARAADPKWAWSAYEPSAENPWDRRKVAHLYRRAALGASWDELEAGVKLGPRAAVDRLLQGGETRDFDRQMEAAARVVLGQDSAGQLKAWWLYRMAMSPHPLREKLTLFWHNHFATSNAKVANLEFMYRQNELLRRHALAKFEPLVQEMSSDPAMLVWLDSKENRKGRPNENYARELMELFTLGIGHYTEQDVKEAARAFTGWRLEAGAFKFDGSQHDDGPKTVLGRQGTLGGEDVVRICLEQPAAAEFVVAKTYRFFVADGAAASGELLRPLASGFRERGYDVAWLVETVLRSNWFFSPAAYRKKVKSPVDYVVGTLRGLEGRANFVTLAEATDQMGQSLFYPPSVKGWHEGPAWINSTTLLVRQNVAVELTSARGAAARCDPAQAARRHLGERAGDAGAVGNFFVELFLQGDVPAAARSELVEYLRQQGKAPLGPYDGDRASAMARAAAHLVLTMPEYQLG